MITPQYILDLNDEIIIDNFAGGGGASTGIEMALGRHVDVAINHDPEAVSMHQANHPQTLHLCESVWEVNPREVMPGRNIGLLWLSPDCKHFSKAKGGKPVEKKIRGLAWVALRWASVRQPRVIALENVEEFITWGPLVIGTDGNMRPCPKNKGREFNAFVNALRRQGYVVEWKELRASDFDTPTIRKRLFLIARRDGQPIVWPEPTNGNPTSEAVKGGKLKPWRTAAECIDWTIPCQSIFLSKEKGRAIGVNRPLSDNTLRRVAKGIMRYVVNAADPFIVGAGGPVYSGKPKATSEPFGTLTAENHRAIVVPYITEHANGSNQRNMPADGPLRTQCAQVKGGHFALVSAFLTKFRTGATGSALTEPMHTITAGPKENPAGCPHAMGIITAHIQRDMGQSIGHAATSPLGTITAGGGGKAALVTSNLVKMRGTNIGQPDDEPLHTLSAQGTHFAEVRAFLVKYYGNEQDGIPLNESIHTVTARDRFGLVTVHGEEYAITDIGLRMLAPRELFRAQGFPYWSKSRRFIACQESLNLNSTHAKFAISNSLAESSNEENELAVVHVRLGSGQLVLELRNHAKYLSFANNAAKQSSFPLPIGIADIVRELAHVEQCLVPVRQHGKVASHQNGARSTHQQNGESPVKLSGCETTPFAGAVENDINIMRRASRSITSPDMRVTQNLDLRWKTLSSYVGNVIASSIQSEIQKTFSFVVDIKVEDGYIIERGLHIDADGNHHWKPLTKSAQVRMCGNSVCPPLAAALIRANCADMIVSKEMKRRSA